MSLKVVMSEIEFSPQLVIVYYEIIVFVFQVLFILIISNDTSRFWHSVYFK